MLARYPELEGALEWGDCASWFEAPPGRLLFDAGQPEPRFALIVEGRVRVVSPGLDADELLPYTVRAGQICAMTALAVLTETPSRIRGVAESQVRGFGLRHQAFRRMLGKNTINI